MVAVVPLSFGDLDGSRCPLAGRNGDLCKRACIDNHSNTDGSRCPCQDLDLEINHHIPRELLLTVLPLMLHGGGVLHGGGHTFGRGRLPSGSSGDMLEGAHSIAADATIDFTLSWEQRIV